jgi:peroxin-19
MKAGGKPAAGSAASLAKGKSAKGNKSKGDDLDLMLDDALDEFEAMEMQRKVDEQQAKENASKKRVEMSEQKRLEAERAARAEELQRMLNGVEDPSFGPTVQSTLKALSTTEEGNATVDDLFSSLSRQFNEGSQRSTSTFLPTGPDDAAGIAVADNEVARTLQMLGEAQRGMTGFEAGRIEEAGESLMEDMISQFEALGEREDYNEVIDGVMRQLLSKDLMYDPTRQICDKFPEWLALHKRNLSDQEYQNYCKQYQTFQKILAIYDTEPDNFPRLMELMFDLQTYGQPPAAIIKDLAPGLQFDENGMPIMPNMGAGMMPGGEGFPPMGDLAGQMAQGKCCVM